MSPLSMNLSTAETTVMQFAATYFPRGVQQATAAILQEYILGPNHTTGLQIVQDLGQVRHNIVFLVSQKIIIALVCPHLD